MFHFLLFDVEHIIVIKQPDFINELQLIKNWDCRPYFMPPMNFNIFLEQSEWKGITLLHINIMIMPGKRYGY